MEFYLLTFLLFFLPFLVFPIGPTAFETIKVFVAEIVIDMVFFVLLFRGKIQINRLLNLKNILLFGIFVLSLLDLILFNKPTTFFGNVFRLQGTFLLWHLLLFSFLVPHLKLHKNYVVFPVISFLTLIISIFIFGFEENGRAVGALGEANALASYAVFLWPFLFLKIENKKSKVLVAVLTLGIIILSGSRSGLIAYIIQIIFLVLNFKTKLQLKFVSIIIIVLILISLLLPYLDKKTLFQSRTNIWRTAVEAGLAHPIMGSGFGNIEIVMQEAANKLRNNIRYEYIDSGHNIVLDYFVQGGIVGVSLFLALVYITIKKFTKNKNILYLVVFFGLFSTLLFNPASVVGLIGLWFLIGNNSN